MRTKKKIFVFITIAALLLTMVGAQGTAQAGPSEMKKVIISFHEAPGQAGEELIKGFGGRVKHNYSIIPAIAATIPDKAITALSKNPRIKMIENDVEIFALDYVAELNDTWGVKHIGAGSVHDGGNLGEGVKVAVIDSGVDCSHFELIGNCGQGYDFVNSDNDPFDDNGHGTHVAGTIAALRNGLNVVGAAPEATIFPYKILDSEGRGDMSDAITALEYAYLAGVKVTNNSYGSSGYPGDAVKEAFDYTAAAGMIHVAAAGNSGNRPGIGDNVGYPARFDSVLAVAATDSKDRRASFSSTGPAVEISAPGVSILSAYPGNYLATMSGTSMASPHVAGTVALMFGVNPEASANQIRSALQSTAVDLGDSGRDNLYGYGLVDAVGAVSAVTGTTPSPSPDQAVNVSLTTDKSEYSNTDTVVLSAVVTDENIEVITGLYAEDFTSRLNGSIIDLAFSDINADGIYTAELVITELSAAQHVLELDVTDARGVTGTGSASFTVIATVEPDPITDKILSADISNMSLIARGVNYAADFTVLITDGSSVIEGVTVLGYWDDNVSGEVSGITDSSGKIVFTSPNLKKPASGTEIKFTVSGVVKDGYLWDEYPVTDSISIP